jgi:predicted RNA binding protein YcfA (HicA-like mRNA interferase family)
MAPPVEGEDGIRGPSPPSLLCRPQTLESGPIDRGAQDEPGDIVPPKIRDLISELEQAGFVNRGGKGSHRNFAHTKVARPITISGAPGDDAKRYQVRAVGAAIKESKS